MVGICACVISANYHLMANNTENVRTALMVTAENIDAGYWDPMEDGRDGCGVVSGYSAAMFAQNVTRKTTSSAPDTMGLAFGFIHDSTRAGTRLTYNIITPAVFPKGKHFRAVLTWTNSQNNNATDRTLSDLNLELWDRNESDWIDLCYSIEDNHEVIDVENSELETHNEYSLEVIVDSLQFPAAPTRDYIKYSLGWTWVNDFAGKKYHDTTFTGDNIRELYNRNIVFDDSTTFENNSFSSITADNRIVLNPGVSIEEGADFTARIVKKILQYDAPTLNLNGNVDSSDTLNLADYSGNNRHGVLFPLIDTVDYILDRFCHDALHTGNYRRTKGAVYIESNDYFLDTSFINPGEQLFDGLTLSMWVKFYRDTVSTGYLFYAYENGEGFYLHVNDLGWNNKELTFHISGGGYQSEVFYNIDADDLSDNDSRKNYNWGCVNVTVVWRAGDEIELYVNGVWKNDKSTNVRYCPFKQCYIGIDPALLLGANSFNGGIDEVRLYIGADSEEHIIDNYHMTEFPRFQMERSLMTIDIRTGGTGMYDIDYRDIEDVVPLTTVQENSDTTIDFPYRFDLEFNALPDVANGYRIDEIRFIDFDKNNPSDADTTIKTILPFDTTSLDLSRYYRIEALFIQ